ncbi:MAG: hypothetical protein IJC16_00165 [Rikenellaceae bacterium]|nr:hypothetical protein [Rikenellaceae bacterium]
MKRKFSLFRLTLAFAVGFMLFGGIGAVAASALAFIPRGAAGVLCAEVIPEVWTGEMVRQFRHDETASFLEGISDYSRYVQNGNTIHLIDFACDPEVLINNTSYPIAIQEFKDGDIAITLDKYQTKATKVTDDELYSMKVDKLAPTIEQHKIRINETKYDKAIHSIAPASHTAKTPVIETTGAEVDGRKQITRKDIIAMKKAFDKMKVPTKGRRLVLCADHVSDLLELDQKFADQYHNYTTGKISNMYGFEVFEYVNMPVYKAAKTKVAFGTAAGEGEFQASVAFYVGGCAKAQGETKFYHQEARISPTTQENLVNFRHYFMVMPKKQLAIGAIMSAKATQG